MQPLRIIFAGTPDFAVPALAALIVVSLDSTAFPMSPIAMRCNHSAILSATPLAWDFPSGL